MEYIESTSADAFNPKFEITSRVSAQRFPQLEGETMSRPLLIQKTLSQVTIAGCTFSHAQLLGSTLDRCRFFDTAFVSSEINGVDFLDCTFTRVSFHTSLLRHTRFDRCSFDECTFVAENGEPIDPNDGVVFTGTISVGTSFVPPLPKATKDDIVKGSWMPSVGKPLAVAEPPPLAVAAPAPAVSPSPTPKCPPAEDGRFGSLEL